MQALQWGGRFAGGPDKHLLKFGSSLTEDLVLAPFDVDVSLAHVEALLGGGLLTNADALLLKKALRTVSKEILDGTFAERAMQTEAEDIHGAIDVRVRELTGDVGERLHAGRSRNDQVATTLLLYVRSRAQLAARQSQDIAASFVSRASDELSAGTIVAGCTHRQPAQPVLLAYILMAWAQPFMRASRRFTLVARDAAAFCPLGGAALAGSTLPLDRQKAAAILWFDQPSLNALDGIGNRDSALDLAHACVRTMVEASRISEELISWCIPAIGYARLGDSAATGSSLMPQKRNPDPFELVRARAATLLGAYVGALGTLCGLAPSYQRDLQETKRVTISIVEETRTALDAFARACDALTFNRVAMSIRAADGYTLATDIADALIARGVRARVAHAQVGARVAVAEAEGRALDDTDLRALEQQLGLSDLTAPLDAKSSIKAKVTLGSTEPNEVRRHIALLEVELAALAGADA